ncbi:MAG: hypothetical protein ACOC6J_09960 [Spirochaetota bacterium]
MIPYDLVDTYLPRALRILRDNNQILYQRDIHLLLRAHHSGSFVLDNDPFDLLTYSRLLANFLFNFNLITDEQRDRARQLRHHVRGEERLPRGRR